MDTLIGVREIMEQRLEGTHSHADFPQVQAHPAVAVLPGRGAAPCPAVVEEALGASVVPVLPLADNLL